MIKFILVLVIIICFTYIGYSLSNYYKKRVVFFTECVNFCNSISLKINFSKSLLKELVDKQIEICKSDLKNILKEFLTSYSLQNIKTYYLSDDEKATVINFINDLGKFDCENQLNQIEKCKKEFDCLLESSTKEKSKYAGLYLKIFFLIGIVISILII